MDPFNGHVPPATVAMFPVYEPLFQLNPATGGLEFNSLGTNYKISNGGLTLTITLRKGVKFQDGTPFNASAVVWNLDQYASSSIPQPGNTTGTSECQPYLTVVNSITATSKYTVQMQLSARDAGLLPLLASQQCALMVSPTAYQREGANNFTNDPVGTGPFAFSSGTPGTVANFTRFSGYWGGKPHLSEVTVEAVSSDAAALQAIQSGAAQAWLDFVDIGSVPQIIQARADSNLVVKHGPAGSITYITFTFTHSPFDNPVAREAVSYATDPAEIDKALYSNLYKPVQGIFPPGSWAYPGSTVKGYDSYNLAKAQQLVQQLHGLTFSVDYGVTPATTQLLEALQAQWQAAGMTVTLVPLSTAQLISNLHALNYQALEINSPGLADPDNATYRWFYSASALTQNGMKNAVIDKYILEARSDYGRATRAKLYTKIDQLISQQAPWDDIAATSPYDIYTKSVHGIVPSPYSLQNWESVYMG